MSLWHVLMKPMNLLRYQLNSHAQLFIKNKINITKYYKQCENSPLQNMYMHFSFSKSSETYQYQFGYIKIQLGRPMYCQIRLGESLVLQASRQMLGLYVRNPF